ncbi:MAG: allophanate hydrolase subunit 1 [Fimbriimonadaceae bacterium]
MRVQRLGDAAFLVSGFGEVPAYRLASAIESCRVRGVVEAVAAYDTVGVYGEPFAIDPAELEASISRLLPSLEREPEPQPVVHEIPVCYALGPDLGEVARRLDLTPEAVVRRHTGSSYTCHAIGFCPGFPYLGYLPEPLCGLPRLDRPRPKVEPGSVAIVGRQTGIYPLPRPGGWWLIGRTPLLIVDVEAGFFPIEPGDRVRFRKIDEDEFARRAGERLPSSVRPTRAGAE